MQRTFVWDGSMRVFHWLLVLAVLVAFFTPERATTLHMLAGYLVLGLLIYRLVWGLVGSTHARFGDFLPSLGRLRTHLAGLRRGRPAPYAGHNPTSALGAWALLLLLAGTVTSALLHIGPLHGLLANLTIVAAVLHVIGLIVEDALSGDRIIASMVHGCKTLPESAGDAASKAPAGRRRLLAAVATAVLVLAGGFGSGAFELPSDHQDGGHEARGGGPAEPEAP